MNNLGALYANMGEYSKAEPYLYQALEIRKNNAEEKPDDYAMTLENAGTIYLREGDFEKAEYHFLKSLEICENALGEQHPQYAKSLYGMGMLYFNKNNYDQAEWYILKALDIKKRIFGENSMEYADYVSTLGVVYDWMGDYVKAEPYLLHAYQIAKNQEEVYNPELVIIVHRLAEYYANILAFQQAEEYYLEELELKKKLLSDQPINYASTLIDIAKQYGYMGNIGKSEFYFQQALNIYRQSAEENTKDCATAYSGMGVVRLYVGDLNQAEQYLSRALEIRKKINGEQNSEYANTCSALGWLCLKKGHYDEAEKYMQKAFEIQKNTLDEENSEYIMALNNLGSIYIMLCDTLKSMQFLHKMEKCIEKQPEMSSYNKATLLNSIGVAYMKIGENKKAKEYFLLACDEGAKSPGNNVYLEQPLNNIVALHFMQKDYKSAEPYFIQCCRLKKEEMLAMLSFLNTTDRENIWNSQNNTFLYHIPHFSYYYYPYKSSISTFAYDNELLYKGFLLHFSNTIMQSIYESGDAVLMKQLEELMKIKRSITKLEEGDPSTTRLAVYRNCADSIERLMTVNSAAYRENMRQWNITWDSVRAALKPNQVAIEYMSALLSEDSTMYCALLLRDTCSYPIMIPLFEEKEVTSLLHNSTEDTTNINTTYKYDGNGAQLFELIWSKVQPYLNSNEEVFISPTGLLHQVALENLPYDSMQTMMDVYNIVRLSSTRELVFHKDYIAHTTATLYGGIKYGVTPDVMYANNLKYRGDIDRDGVKELPGTKHEMEVIAPVLRAKSIDVHIYSGDTANEESFKALSGQKQNILHIGTHGFYWTDSTAQRAAYFKQRTLSIDNDRYGPMTIDPLNRCGLLFAGASTAISGDAHRLQEGVQDGVLTAKEISLLDLREADIVVLSACETGLGDVTGDGVFGLQRAFKMAGVRTILMSLWKVDDDATRVFMTSFYRNLCDGQSKREAFRNAQQEVRNYTGTADTETESIDRADAQDRFKNKVKPSNQNQSLQSSKKNQQKYPYRSPYYWAGFILLD